MERKPRSGRVRGNNDELLDLRFSPAVTRIFVPRQVRRSVPATGRISIAWFSEPVVLRRIREPPEIAATAMSTLPSPSKSAAVDPRAHTLSFPRSPEVADASSNTPFPPFFQTQIAWR